MGRKKNSRWKRLKKWFDGLSGRLRNGILLTFASVFFVFVLNGILDLLPEIVSPLLSIIIGIVGLLVLGFLGFGKFAGGKK